MKKEGKTKKWLWIIIGIILGFIATQIVQISATWIIVGIGGIFLGEKAYGFLQTSLFYHALVGGIGLLMGLGGKERVKYMGYGLVMHAILFYVVVYWSLPLLWSLQKISGK